LGSTGDAHAQGFLVRQLAGDGRRRPPNFAKDKFDQTFWEWVSDPKYIRVLQLKAGRHAALAIDAILEGLNAWRIDCDHTVQIANLFAVRMIFGPAQFGVRVGPQMRLRDRESTRVDDSLAFWTRRSRGLVARCR